MIASHSPLPLVSWLLLSSLEMLTATASAQQAHYAASYHAAQAAAHQQQQVMMMRQQQMATQPRAQPFPAYLRFDGRYAATPVTFPPQIQHAVYAGNAIQNKPYRRGGGHSNVHDSAYDCSGSVSFVLIKAGLLRSPMPSTGFASYGRPGPGRFITIYVKPGEHVFMTICGLRLDTGGGSREQGPRWRPTPRSTAGFMMRHPPGF